MPQRSRLWLDVGTGCDELGMNEVEESHRDFALTSDERRIKVWQYNMAGWTEGVNAQSAEGGVGA